MFGSSEFTTTTKAEQPQTGASSLFSSQNTIHTMSTTPVPSFHRRKKGELKELLQSLGLPVDGLRSDLEERIRSHLETNEISSNDYVTNFINSTPSPVKRRVRSETPSRISTRVRTKTIINGIKIEPESDTEEFPSSALERKYADPHQPLRRSTRRSIKEESRFDGREDEEEDIHDTERALGTAQNGNALSQNPSKDDTFSYMEPVVHNLETDIASTDITAIISARTETAWRSIRKSLRVGYIWGYLKRVQKKASNARTIVLSSLLLECAIFLANGIPWTYHVIVGPTQYYLFSEPVTHDFRLPNFLVLLTWSFWQPFLLWFGLLLALPALASFLVNFEPRRATYSPLTFSLVKLATAVYATRDLQVLDETFAHIPATLVFIDAGFGIVYSLYEAVVAKK